MKNLLMDTVAMYTHLQNAFLPCIHRATYLMMENGDIYLNYP
ncbi:hypothetical protein [Beggiatoa leptomitoformis]|nr:hypothetical protein [Beggiatoa leptomitoformis]